MAKSKANALKYILTAGVGLFLGKACKFPVVFKLLFAQILACMTPEVKLVLATLWISIGIAGLIAAYIAIDNGFWKPISSSWFDDDYKIWIFQWLTIIGNFMMYYAMMEYAQIHAYILFVLSGWLAIHWLVRVITILNEKAKDQYD